MHKPHPTQCGFTLIELLVVISIIALLISILLPALGGVRDTAKQMKALSAERQLMTAYTVYQNDYDGHLLFSYPPAFVHGKPFVVRMPSGHQFSTATTGALPIIRYPGRLAGYVSDVWEILYDHVPPPDLPNASDTEVEAEGKLYTLSVAPSFGINSVYVGGDFTLDYKGFAVGTGKPNRGEHVVFRDIESKTPSQLIVFTESLLRGGGVESGDGGNHRVTPPRANGLHWHSENNKMVIDNTSSVIGLPQSRFTPATATAFLDGHAEVLTPDELDDMRLWANTATIATVDPVP